MAPELEFLLILSGVLDVLNIVAVASGAAFY